MCSARSRARTGSGRWLIRSPADPDGAAVRVVEPARQASRVDLPDPEGPTTATTSPAADVERDTAQGERLVVARAEEAVDRACRDGGCGSAASPVMRATAASR